MIFSAFCDQAGAEVLLGPDNVTEVTSGPWGLELRYRCHCGQLGVIYPQLARDPAPRKCA
jgi:hypothetical protein